MRKDHFDHSGLAGRVAKMPVLPADTFVSELVDVCTALANRLEREWPTSREEPPLATLILRSLVLASGNTFATIRYVCSDAPDDPLRKIEYSLALAPLIRVILEATFTTIFLFNDLRANVEWFARSGWRDNHEEYLLLRTTFGEDTEWQQSLHEYEELSKKQADNLKLTFEQRQDPKNVAQYWPTPGRMIASDGLSPDRRARMTYLNTWFYGRLSSSSHLKWPGLVKASVPLLFPKRDEDIKAGLIKSRSDVFGSSAVMLLALLSEIEIELAYGHSERLSYVWGVLSEVFQYTKSLYESHYKARLLRT